jgi:hypothetical protein
MNYRLRAIKHSSGTSTGVVNIEIPEMHSQGLTPARLISAIIWLDCACQEVLWSAK